MSAAAPQAVPFPNLVAMMIRKSEKVSDLIFSPGRPPQVEMVGKLEPVPAPGWEMLTPELTAAIASHLIGENPVAKKALQDDGAADIAYAIPRLSRFRVNVFMQRGTHAIVMRVIPMRVPTFDELHLPEVLRDIVDMKNGIVLVTGPTGSGKSSTLAAVIDLINETHAYHVVTVEDPIEFMHSHKKATIHQRELHADCPSFSRALRSALRQAPKVILVGEMRDQETIEIALEASETGQLVLSTLHTTEAAKTVDRIIGVFPKNEEQVIRTRLSNAFRFIVSQRLLPRQDGMGRVAAIEVLRSNLRTREYIEKGAGGGSEGKSLLDAMKDGGIEGMATFDQVIEQLVRKRAVTMEVALQYATNAGNLRLELADFAG
jgi:twitching motility protein PilT